MIRIYFVLLVVFYPLICSADSTFPEPFGLKWGMSEADLIKIGFKQTQESEGFKILASVSVPKAWSKGEIYGAVTYKGRLVKIIATSTDFTNDILGSEGKEEYNKMKLLLTNKYGVPESHHEFIGNKLYDDADEFYQCLEYVGCGAYMALFKIDGGNIGVQLNGKSRGIGYLTITYESPEFSIAKQEVEKSDVISDEGAF